MRDTTAPTTTASPRGGLFTAQTSVTLSCSDGAGVGCAATYYTLDGSTPTQGSLRYTSSLYIEASTTLRFLSVDRAGNLEAPRSEEFVVDSRPPGAFSTPRTGTYNTALSVSLTCDDGSGSGCVAIHYTLDGSMPSTASPVYAAPLPLTTTTTLRFIAVDRAGLLSPVGTEFFTVEGKTPMTAVSPAGGVFNKATEVSLSCFDADGDCVRIHYTLDGTEPTKSSPVYARPFVVSSTTRLRFFAVDALGNEEALRSEAYTLDAQPPSVAATPRGGTYAAPREVTLTCTDVGDSGCASIHYTTDSSAPTLSSPRYEKPFSLTGDASLRFIAVDHAGNVSASGTESYRVAFDTTPPTTLANPPGGVTSWQVSVTLTCSDGTGVGCDRIRYTLDDSEPTASNGLTYSRPIVIASNKQLRFRGVDLLGNWEATRTGSYYIDTTPPRTRAEPAGGAFDGPIAVRLTCEDSETDCVETRYTVDGSAPTTSSPRYTEPVLVGQTTTVRFLSVDRAGHWEAPRQETYVMDASSAASAQIAAVRAANGGPLPSMPIDGAFITFIKPGVGTDPHEPEGFFLQAEKKGPALFVAVPLASLNPVPVSGERVSVRVNHLVRPTGVLRASIDVASYTVLGRGYPMKALAQDVSTLNVTADFSRLESELLFVRGTIADVFPTETRPDGFLSARLATAGMPVENAPTGPWLWLRRRDDLESGPELTPGCTLSLTSPLWGAPGTAEPTLWRWEQVERLECPTPRVEFAQALSPSQVMVRFDRRLDASSVEASGRQFSIPGLTVTSAALQGAYEVRLQTSAQVPRGRYEVTVADTVKDRMGGRVSSFNRYPFRGHATPARLRISEVDPVKTASAEGRVELEVLQAGPMTNMTLWMGTGTQPHATLPDVDVAVGDIVVVHIGPGRVSETPLPRSEVTSKSELSRFSYPLAHDAAWDVRGSTTASFARGNHVLRLKDPFGNLQDGLVLNASFGSTYSFFDEVQALQSESGWLPATCGGARCTDVSSPSVFDISVNCDVGDGFSMGRIRAEDSDSKADWALQTKSIGSPNPRP